MNPSENLVVWRANSKRCTCVLWITWWYFDLKHSVLLSQCHTQNFLTELASGRKQLDDITKLGEELVKKQHSKKKEIQLRLGNVTRRYVGKISIVQPYRPTILTCC